MTASCYRISREHPLIADALDSSGDAQPLLERALRLVEESVPIAGIVMDASEDPDRVPTRAPFEGRSEEVMTLLRDRHAAMVQAGARPRDALATLADIEPFDQHPELIAVLDEEFPR